jgi:hypothetical protein
MQAGEPGQPLFPESQRRAARRSSALPEISAAPISLFCTQEAVSPTA